MSRIHFVDTSRALAVGGALVLIVSACSAGAGGTSSPPPPASPTVAATMTAEPSAAPTDGTTGYGGGRYGSGASPTAATTGTVTVAISQKSGLGSFLTGEGGMTLYVFAKDAANTSNCSGGCVDNWPPLEVSAASDLKAGAGVTGKLGTFTRSDDGKLQVTYNGKPLYYFAGDQAAGDTNGSSINNWAVAAP
jgi:predicted lipoprotein with Yx(FWY)xxD motif